MPDLAVAHRLIPVRRRSDGVQMGLDPALEIGVGGEARVLGVRWDAGIVAKLYHRPTFEHARKLALMMEAPPALPAGAGIAWPLDLLTDPRGARFAGFLMPRAEGPRIFEFYNPVSRRKTAPLFDWARLHRAGVNLAAAFDALHAAGYVVGDVNESNILVSPVNASVVLVDADSFQVRGPRPRELYRSKVGKAEFTPPELQGTHFADVDRGPEHDRFGLAVLLFLLLMEGTHPFALRLADGGEVPPVEDRIQRGMFPHAEIGGECRPPRMAPPFYSLHPEIQALFLRAFVAGHADPAARPAAAEWSAALAAAEASLATCAANPRHRYAAHVEVCPWCHRSRVLQGRDPFPATVDQARAHLPPPPRRAPQPPAPYPAPRPFAPPVPAAAAVPMPPPQPSALSIWANARLTQAQSSLPAWAQPALGPDGLGNPVVWMPPAALTCLFGATGGLRVLGMLVFFLALRRVFRLNSVRLRPITLAWIALLLLLWTGVTGVLGPGFGARSEPDLGPMPVPAVPLAPQPPPVRTQGAVQRVSYSGPAVVRPPSGFDWAPPELFNRGDVDAAAAEAYPSRLLDLGIGGEAVVSMRLDTRGHVEPGSVQVVQASRTELGFAAAALAGRMDFYPALVDGNPVPVTVQVTVSFNPDA